MNRLHNHLHSIGIDAGEHFFFLPILDESDVAFGIGIGGSGGDRHFRQFHVFPGCRKGLAKISMLASLWLLTVIREYRLPDWVLMEALSWS